MIRLAAALAMVMAGAACASMGGVRPRYGPVPGAELLSIEASPDAVTRALERAVRERGLDVLRWSAVEGYVETDWYDLDARRPTGPPFARADRIVKLRFFSDPAAGRTRLLAESVYRVAYDPSIPQRELERMTPAGHPGRALLDSILAPLRPPRDTTTGGASRP